MRRVKFNLKQLQLDEIIGNRELSNILNISTQQIYNLIKSKSISVNQLRILTDKFGVDKIKNYHGGII